MRYLAFSGCAVAAFDAVNGGQRDSRPGFARPPVAAGQATLLAPGNPLFTPLP